MQIFCSRRKRTQDHNLRKVSDLGHSEALSLCYQGSEMPVLELRGSAQFQTELDFPGLISNPCHPFLPHVSTPSLLQFLITLQSVIQYPLLQEALSAYMNVPFVWILTVLCCLHLVFHYSTILISKYHPFIDVMLWATRAACYSPFIASASLPWTFVYVVPTSGPSFLPSFTCWKHPSKLSLTATSLMKPGLSDRVSSPIHRVMAPVDKRAIYVHWGLSFIFLFHYPAPDEFTLA